MSTYHAKLTDFCLKSIKPATKGQDEHYDTTLSGFAVRVGTERRGKAGQILPPVKAFTLIYRYGGTARRWTIGRYPALTLAQARDIAKEGLHELAKGKDPQTVKISHQMDKLTFVALVDEFLLRHGRTELKTKTRRDYEGCLRRYFLPRWKNLPADSIQPDDILSVLKRLQDLGKVAAANNARAIIRKLFSWAVDNKLLQANPAKDIKRLGKPVKRKRWLHEEEIKQFWKACDQLGYPFGPYFKLLLLLGQRESEIAAMKRSDIRKGVWYMPAENKSARENEIPLSKIALDIIESLPDTGNDLLFTTTGTTPVSGFSKAKKRLDKLMQVEKHWRIHDLRRTLRTWLPKFSVPRVVSELLLNHSLKGLDEIYDHHDYMDEKRRALEKWATRIESIAHEEESKVIPYRVQA